MTGIEHHNASCAQYPCPPTPTPTWPVVTPTPSHQLPYTGFVLGYEVSAGLLIVVLGVAGLVFTGEWLRAWRRRRV